MKEIFCGSMSSAEGAATGACVTLILRSRSCGAASIAWRLTGDVWRLINDASSNSCEIWRCTLVLLRCWGDADGVLCVVPYWLYKNSIIYVLFLETHLAIMTEKKHEPTCSWCLWLRVKLFEWFMVRSWSPFWYRLSVSLCNGDSWKRSNRSCDLLIKSKIANANSKKHKLFEGFRKTKNQNGVKLTTHNRVWRLVSDVT